MDEPPNPPSRRLAPREVVPAVHQSLGETTAPDGFLLLGDDPELYNKWLYTAPTGGRHRVYALSRRFCPFMNQQYAGASIYDPALGEHPDLIPIVRPCALTLLGYHGDAAPDDLIRGAFGRLGSYSREEYDNGDQLRAVLERDFDENKVVDERRRVRWLSRAGPVWGNGEISARFARYTDHSLLYQYQNCLRHDICLPIERERMRSGIRTILDYAERHHHLSIFTFGGFVLLENKARVIGCAWCYRSFDPVRAGWTVWVRHLYIPQSHRRLGFCGHFFDAAVGFFAEAGFPVRVRTVAPVGTEGHAAVRRRGFEQSDDFFFYFNK